MGRRHGPCSATHNSMCCTGRRQADVAEARSWSSREDAPASPSTLPRLEEPVGSRLETSRRYACLRRSCEQTVTHLQVTRTWRLITPRDRSRIQSRPRFFRSQALRDIRLPTHITSSPSAAQPGCPNQQYSSTAARLCGFRSAPRGAQPDMSCYRSAHRSLPTSAPKRSSTHSRFNSLQIHPEKVR